MSLVDARVPLELSRHAESRDVTRAELELSATAGSAGAAAAGTSAGVRTSTIRSSISLVSTL
jgi:hypothetical protein